MIIHIKKDRTSSLYNNSCQVWFVLACLETIQFGDVCNWKSWYCLGNGPVNFGNSAEQGEIKKTQ